MADLLVGTVSVPATDKWSYLVTPRGGRYSQIVARYLDNGIQRPYDQGETVLCAYADGVWVILGRVPTPVTATQQAEGDLEKTTDELAAEQLADLKLQLAQGSNLDGLPNYRPKSERPLLPGDVSIKHTGTASSVTTYADGSFVVDTGGILTAMFSTVEDLLGLRMERLHAEIVPGAELDVGLINPSLGQVPASQPSSEYTAGVTDVSKERKKLRGTLLFQSDPDGTVPDCLVEAGRCQEIGDWGNGISSRTVSAKLSTGLKVRLGDFADFEIDLKNKEIRLTVVDPNNPTRFTPAPFQVRMNPDEFVLTRGTQFISFRDEGIFLKGDVVGLAGPWTMWSQADLATFTHQSVPATRVDGKPFLDPVCDWKDDPLAPGIKVVTSAYFGQNEEPAVLQKFLTDHYKKDIAGLLQHTHTSSTPGSPTSPPTAPPTALADWATSQILYSDTTGNLYLDQISKINI